MQHITIKADDTSNEHAEIPFNIRLIIPDIMSNNDNLSTNSDTPRLRGDEAADPPAAGAGAEDFILT